MVHELPPTFEAISLGAMLVLLIADLLIVGRRPHVPSMKESAIWVSFYVGLAVIFGVVVWAVGGITPAAEFYAGWLMEYSLSVDNLFVFVIIMARFAVPREQQQRVLMVGIIMALIFSSPGSSTSSVRSSSTRRSSRRSRRSPRSTTTTRRTSSSARCGRFSRCTTSTTARSCGPPSTVASCSRR
jgi:hypothetical protein